MKKPLKIIIIILISIILIFGSLFLYLFISNLNHSPKVGTWSLNKINSKYVSMKIDKETLTNKSATLTISNNTKDKYHYGQAYTIEYYRNGMWHYLKPISDEVAWQMIGIFIEPNSKNEMELNWENYYGKLPKGKYRVVKEFNSYGTEKNIKINATAEFIIE